VLTSTLANVTGGVQSVCSLVQISLGKQKQELKLQELDDAWLAHQDMFQNAALAKRSS
jgi:hypothetical protein